MSTSIWLIVSIEKSFFRSQLVIILSNETLFPENNVSKMTSILKNNLVKNKQLTFTGHPKERLPNNLSFLCHTKSMIPINGREIVRLLSQHGVYISSGSACSSSSQGPNPILVAINIDKTLNKYSITAKTFPPFPVERWILDVFR